jgi:SAM-dependent methyltransferase
VPAETAYEDTLADWFAENANTSPYNAYCDLPAVLDLIGDCRGLRILDVGCGAGHYAAELTHRGASVVGIEGSPRLLEHAAHRLGDRVELRQHDLETPLTFAADASYDGAVMALVIQYVDARRQLLAELARVVRPGAWLVVSTMHPTADWNRFGGSYYAVEKVDRPVAQGRWNTHYWRVPLETFFAELLGAGFVLERLVEPRPMPELQQVNPEAHHKLHTAPCFLAVKLQRRLSCQTS